MDSKDSGPGSLHCGVVQIINTISTGGMGEISVLFVCLGMFGHG